MTTQYTLRRLDNLPFDQLNKLALFFFDHGTAPGETHQGGRL